MHDEADPILPGRVRKARGAQLAWIPWWYTRGNKPEKRAKARAERRRAKLWPEAPPTYGRYAGWYF